MPNTPLKARVLRDHTALYPTVKPGRWYPIIRRDPNDSGFYIRVSGGPNGEHFVWDKHFDVAGSPDLEV